MGTGEAINERPLGFPFPAYAERQARMQEALEIIHRLFAGEKISFDGTYYQTESARLYSPPVGSLPVMMAAGGPKSAAFAGRYADGLITSVKQPEDTLAKVIEPYRRAAAKRSGPQLVLATRWTVLAENDEKAWICLLPDAGACAPRGGWRRPTRPSCGCAPTRWSRVRCSPATRASRTPPG